MLAYRYNPETFLFECEQCCQRDPLESTAQGKDVFLLPGNCTLQEPPTPKEGFDVVWNGDAWEYKELPKDPEPEKTEPLTAEQQQEQQKVQFIMAIQRRLDTFAQERGYDNIMSVCTYADSTIPRFKQEAQTAILLRDQTWAKGYEILDAVLSGKRAMPTIEEVFAELPLLVWGDVASAEQSGQG